MKNENKKNYYNLLKGQLQICEDKQNEELRKQWEEDINFEKQELEKKYVEERYYRIFVDRFLVDLIEKIIKQTKDKNDLENKYCIRLIYLHEHSVDPYDIKYDNASICLEVPLISSNAQQWITSKDDIGILCDLNKNFDTIYRHISFYSEIFISATSTPLYNMLGGVKRFLDEKIISFECTLKDLINMYYMEKQRQIHEIFDEYENDDAKKTKNK